MKGPSVAVAVVICWGLGEEGGPGLCRVPPALSSSFSSFS